MLIDGTPVYENTAAKEKLFFISDDQYYFPNASAKDMMDYYAMIYQDFDRRKFKEYLEKIRAGYGKKDQYVFEGDETAGIGTARGMCQHEVSAV